ncbi:tail sheath protein [Klebsiella phage CPRSA]|nr:tail sheath protein [Klebsiella phage CPRSA]
MNVSSSYAFIDGNYKFQYDKYNDVNRWIPLAGDMAGLCVYTDQVSQPWMSPAGYNRGQLRNCIKLAIEPTNAHRDSMYQVQINAVTGFSGGAGYILYGDKTATTVPSPFDRINVRRLFNMIKKTLAITQNINCLRITMISLVLPSVWMQDSICLTFALWAVYTITVWFVTLRTTRRMLLIAMSLLHQSTSNQHVLSTTSH